MENISSVVKSKSSNSAKTNRSEHHEQNKKSRSNAEFQPNVLKKRGVYVEKKHTNMSFNESANNEVQERPIKAPPRPKAGNKKFLASVLTILSKSTTGTQYPDANDTLPKRKTRRRVTVRNNSNNVDSNNANNKVVKRKTKYKSKALNDDVEKEVRQEKVVVLQSKKDMIQTPSIYSENGSFNWSNLPSLVKNGQQNKEIIERNVTEVANELAKEIMDGQKFRKDKRVRIDESNTLVCVTKEPNKNPTNEKDKGLYNFFVDLLETTMSIYNVKAEYDKTPNPPSEGSSVKIPLVIDESVAKKLDVRQANPQKTEEAVQPENQFYCLKDLEFGQQGCCPPLPPSKSPRKKKFQAESFSFLRKPTRKMKTESVVETKRYSRREKKRTLLNLFKEQLRIDDDEFKEPQNLYEALKVIAQNKRRCQKTIHFENSRRRNKKDMGYPECMFKGRKVISPSTKSTKNKNSKPVPTASVSGRYSERSAPKKMQKTAYVSDYDDSYHSLKVYGFEYENSAAKKPVVKTKQLVFTYHSTPSGSDFGIASNNELSESDTNFYNDYYDF